MCKTISSIHTYHNHTKTATTHKKNTCFNSYGPHFAAIINHVGDIDRIATTSQPQRCVTSTTHSFSIAVKVIGIGVGVV